MNPPVRRNLQLWGVQVALCGLLVSCVGCMGSWARPRLPFQRQPEVCVFPDGVGKAELIDYLNRNQSSIQAWRCTEATVKIAGPGGVPVTLTANLAVERPRNIRLRAKSIRGDEADLGSNEERFWFWIRDAQDRILTASHADAQLVRDHLQLPFEPEWLMEALGVGYIDPARYTMQHHGPGTNRATLISAQASAHGQILHREIVVDTCRGHIIEHGISDMNHQPIARAILGEYRTVGTVSLPHNVELIWSRSGQRMRMRLRNIEVNPQTNLQKMWAFPQINGAQAVDIGDQIRRRQQTMGTTQLLPDARSEQLTAPRSAAPPGAGLQTTTASRWEQPVMRQVSDTAAADPASAADPAIEEPEWAPELPGAEGDVGRARIESTGPDGTRAPEIGITPWLNTNPASPGTPATDTGVVRLPSTEPVAEAPAEPPWAGAAP